MSDSQPQISEIDPELVALRRRTPTVGPLLVLCVIGLAFYFMIQLRADLAYSFSAAEPEELGSAAEVLRERGGLPVNAWVATDVVPDYRAPARVRGRQDTGHRLAPVLGTDARLWLHVDGEALAAPVGFDDRYVGRLRRLADLPVAGGIREYVGSLPPLPRYLDARLLAGAAPPPWRDVGGDTIAPTPDARVDVEERVAGVGLVSVLKLDVPDDRAAWEVLVTHGIAEGPMPIPYRSTETVATFEVPSPGGAPELRDRLAAAKLPQATADPKLVRHTARFDEVFPGAGNGSVRVGGGRTIPLAAVERAAVYLPPEVPADAWVLVVGEAPGAFWYMPIVYGLLLLFAAFMIWSLVRTIRSERAVRRATAGS